LQIETVLSKINTKIIIIKKLNMTIFNSCTY